MRLGLKAACFSVQKHRKLFISWRGPRRIPFNCIHEFTAAFWPLVEKLRGFCDLHLEFYSLTQKAPFLNREIRAHSLRNTVSLGIRPFYPLFNIHQYERSGIPVFSKYQALIVHCRRFALNGSSAISGAQFLLDSNPPCRLKSIDLFLMPPRGGYCDFPSLAFHDQRIASGSSAGM
ncbi:hypothetical protein PGT21_033657 [Puccinia graminis f. sp. tritici]|uniref:Uncharacterized protein n=1 Tax=Puccinia graminis f. sp. tritici TaxID=56615 RepID=A0A5B0MZN1_PUCGR|nr:hypothetical protein PGT21_033657 [Puccinia graminis f. sp. tritici]